MKKKPLAMPKPDEDYEARNDMDTLMRAEEIKGDEHRMKRVHKHLKGHKKKIRSIEDLKALHQAKFGETESPAEDAAEGGKEE